MKIVVLVLFFLATSASAEILPNSWHAYVKGIKVTEKSLGQYKGKKMYEDESFFVFKKTINTKDATISCIYPVHYSEFYLAMVSCEEF